MGSYSFPSVTATREDRDTLRSSEHEIIHFCGEATARENYGTAGGAFVSGKKLATAIINAQAASTRRPGL